jgi:hypothetical protein
MRPRRLPSPPLALAQHAHRTGFPSHCHSPAPSLFCTLARTLRASVQSPDTVRSSSRAVRSNHVCTPAAPHMLYALCSVLSGCALSRPPVACNQSSPRRRPCACRRLSRPHGALLVWVDRYGHITATLFVNFTCPKPTSRPLSSSRALPLSRQPPRRGATCAVRETKTKNLSTVLSSRTASTSPRRASNWLPSMRAPVSQRGVRSAARFD